MCCDFPPNCLPYGRQLHDRVWQNTFWRGIIAARWRFFFSSASYTTSPSPSPILNAESLEKEKRDGLPLHILYFLKVAYLRKRQNFAERFSFDSELASPFLCECKASVQPMLLFVCVCEDGWDSTGQRMLSRIFSPALQTVVVFHGGANIFLPTF